VKIAAWVVGWALVAAATEAAATRDATEALSMAAEVL
jgi:hypothetical protein